ncbi:MAG: glycerate kinase [Muribaculaceae bacterium]|nr:glycerate kinase [Muribaculaceae bacterium]
MQQGIFVIAADSFKGSLSSLDVGKAAERGIKAVLPSADVRIVPVADGGEGTVEAVVTGTKGQIITCEVRDPLGNSVKATYGISGNTAVIEMAAASGLPLVPSEKRNPWLTDTYGTGQLISDALKRGCRHFLIGLGGSATNDAGTGMLRALGFRFLDFDGCQVGNGGGEVGRIVSIDNSEIIPELAEATFTVACDVTNPLTGPDGASFIYGPQKGANPEMVVALDKGLAHFAEVTKEFCGKDFSTFPGAGAAGGLGFAFLAFLRGNLKAGIEMILDAVDFDEKIKYASLVITGEGRLDQQTCMGKTPHGVLQHAAAQRIPVIAIGGSVVPDAVPDLLKAGFTAVFPIVAGPVSLSEAMQPNIAFGNIERTVTQIIRTILLR